MLRHCLALNAARSPKCNPIRPPCPGFTSHLYLHGGRSARMLALLLLAHPGTFAMLGSLYGGAMVAINQILLPTIALLSVRTHCHGCCASAWAVSVLVVLVHAAEGNGKWNACVAGCLAQPYSGQPPSPRV